MPPAFELEQAEQHAGADPAGEKRQVGLRQVALDEPDVLRRALDIVRRADDAQDVAALRATRPRLARHQLGAAMERLEVDAARPRVLRQRAERLRRSPRRVVTTTAAVCIGTDSSAGVVDLRSDVPLRAGGTRRGARRPRADRRGFSASAGSSFSSSPPRCTRCTDSRSAAKRSSSAATVEAGRHGVLDAVRAQRCMCAAEKTWPLLLPPESCCSSAFASLLQVRPHDLRAEPGEEQNQPEIAEPVGNRVRKRRVGDERGLGGIGNRQLGDRAEPGAERRRLGHAARQQPHGQAFVEAERTR